MSHRGINHRPSPESVTTPAELLRKLHELRWWAGQPSLRRLRQLGEVNRTADGTDEVDALPESTTSYVLRGDRPASAEFVRNFVAACLRVLQYDQDEIAEQVERWHDAWLASIAGTEPPTDRPAAGPPQAVSSPHRQLPAEIAEFTGRAAECAALVAQAGAAASVPAVLAITGAAGVGKTTLAVRVSHRLADRFPDGQLFIDLHGFTPTRTPIDPADALERLLRTLGIPGERIPSALEDRAALWRTGLAGRRMLILLDNVATEQQVAPLLPGAPGCVVVATSRRRLAALEATGTVPLDLLPQPDAVALFERAAGREGPGQARELVAEVVEQCGRLPLAIRIAAARLRSHPAWGAADLLSRLRDQHRLAELADEAGTRSVATAIEVSYRQLTAEQQRLYRGLSLHPGPAIDPYAAAALLGSSVARAHRLLDQLLDVHLLQEPVAGRYTFHDLVRAHATTASSGRGRRSRRAAATRLRNYYLYAAARAMDAAYPFDRSHRPLVPPIRTSTPELVDPVAAITWLDTELSNLLATAHDSTEHGPAELVWQLAATLHRHLRTRSHCRDAELLYQRTLRLSRATDHPGGEREALLGLGWVGTAQGRYQPALESLTRALRIARTTGHRSGELRAQLGLGLLHRLRGRHRPALDSLTRALEIARAAGDRSAAGEALRGVGEVHMIRGRYQPAQDCLTQALEIARAIGDPSGEWTALSSLAAVHRCQGQLEPARASYLRGLAVAQASGSRHGELNALCGLGHVYLAQQQYEPARDTLRRALEISRATGYHQGEVNSLLTLGHVHRLEHQYAQASEHYRRTLRVAEEIGDRNWQFEARQSLGRLQHATGEPGQAVAHHQAALELAIALGQPADQARAHDGLAHAYHALGQPAPARQHWQHALDILSQLATDHTEDKETTAPAIRANLASLDREGLPVSDG